MSFVPLWGAVSAFYGQWVPVAVAALFGVGLLITDRFDFLGVEVGRSGFRRGRGWPS